MLAFDILAISDFYFTWESFAYMLIGLLLLPQFENPFTKRIIADKRAPSANPFSF